MEDTLQTAVQLQPTPIGQPKPIIGEDWLTVFITLWPIVAVVALVLFRKQFEEMLSDLMGISFGSFSLKLRRRILKSATPDQFEKIKRFSAYDLKFFFALALQHWKVQKISWKMETQEVLTLAEKLEHAGLVVITNKASALKDNNVAAGLTPLGEEFYTELTSLISQSMK